MLYVWYDNEFGYTVQVLRCMQKMAGIEMPLLPKKRSRNSHVKLLRLAAGAFFHGIKGRTLLCDS